MMFTPRRLFVMLVAALAVSAVSAQASCDWNGYDLSSLMGTDYIGKDGANIYSYYLRVCGSLEDEPSCAAISANASACQVQVNPQGPSFISGEWTGEPVWSFIDETDISLGIQYSLTGAPSCWATGQPTYYTANVQFACGNTFGPLVVTQPADSCQLNYTLTTPLACPSGPSGGTCGFAGFDFTSLMSSDIKGTDGGQTYEYVLKVCGTLDGPAAPGCVSTDVQASACQIQASPAGGSWVIGDFSTSSGWHYVNPANPNQGVGYTLQGDKQCWATGSPTAYSADINFVCAENESLFVDTPPASCHQVWTLYTPLACRASASCTWNGYDFSSLQNSALEGSDGTNTYQYWLQVCGTLSSPAECVAIGTDTEACQIQVTPAGAAYPNGFLPPNTYPNFEFIDASQPSEGVTYQITGGQSCWASGSPTNYYTNVNLRCAQTAAPMTVEYLGGSSCTYNYTVYTPLACPPPPMESKLIALE